MKTSAEPSTRIATTISHADFKKLKAPPIPKTPKEAWTEYLDSKPWDFFCTFTTPYEMTLPSSRRLMSNYYRRAVNLGVQPIFFWVAEVYRDKEGYHTHGFIKIECPEHMQGVIAQYLWQLWQFTTVHKGQQSTREDGKIFNRCKIEVVDPKRRGSDYLTKLFNYSQKQRVDYDLLLPWNN